MRRTYSRRAIDHVVITGDLTNLALEPEFELAREVIRDDLGLDASRVSIVPGNHDVYTSGSERTLRFSRYFADYLASDLPLLGASVPAGRFPFVKLRGPVANRPLERRYAPAVRCSRPPRPLAAPRPRAHPRARGGSEAYAGHRHPPPDPQPEVAPQEPARGGGWDAPELTKLLERQTHGLVLHGHLHRRVSRDLRTGRGLLASVGATSASLHHADADRSAGFNLYEIDDAGRITRQEAHVFEPERSTFRTQDIPSGDAW